MRRSCLVKTHEKSRSVKSRVLLHFPRFPLNKRIWRKGLLPSNENDVLKQIRAFISMRGLSTSACPDSHPPTTQKSIFVKSQVKKWLFSLLSGELQACILYNKLVLQVSLSFKGGGPAPAARHGVTHFALGLGSFKNMNDWRMAATRYFNWF